MAQIKIFWISSAGIQLRLIKEYYNETAGINAGDKNVYTLKVYADILKTHPEAGQIEETLKSLHEGHRYLVNGNYKIIYKKLNNSIFITDIFDTRQNPKKLKKRNS
jgi:toxin ParE1/3/4